MTINGLFAYVKKYSPESIQLVDIEKLKGRRVAVDGNYFMYSSMAVARKEIIHSTDLRNFEPDIQAIRKKWFSSFCYFILKWLKNGITPVVVFDSTTGVPIEKNETRLERKEARDKQRELISKLKEELANEDCLFTSSKTLEALQKAMSNYNLIEKEDYENFQYCAVFTGVPVLIAKGDGEKLCSMLAREGKVAAVYSADSDNIAYGCPYLIRKFEGNKLEMVFVDQVVKNTGLTFSQFQDLCIISGCDYNKNIQNYAFMKCLKLLKKHECVENFPVDFSATNYVQCRKFFSIENSSDCIEKQIYPPQIYDEDTSLCGLNINKAALFLGRDQLGRFECAHFVGDILRVIEDLPTPIEGYWDPLYVSTKKIKIPVFKK